MTGKFLPSKTKAVPSGMIDSKERMSCTLEALLTSSGRKSITLP